MNKDIVVPKEEWELLEVFRRELFLEDSIRGLQKKTGNSSYGRIFDATMSLVKEGVLFAKTQGKSTVCSINLAHEKTLCCFSFLAAQQTAREISKELRNTFEVLRSLIPLRYYTFILFEDNLVLIVDNEVDSSRISGIISHYLKVHKPNIVTHVFRVSECEQMLLSREKTLMHSLLYKGFVVYGQEHWYRLLQEVKEYGFRG